ncbi:MAG: helix-turn-helix domain-containing protein [Alphaproteobacteria bacterium]
MVKKNPHVGSSLEDFLAEQGILDESEAVALKRVIAWQFGAAMKQEKVTKAQMARRMGTSRPSVDRLLDPSNTAVTLKTLTRAANALGKSLSFQLSERAR